MKEKKTITKALASQYRRASKGAKGRLLEQLVEATGYNRSYAGWLLRHHGLRVEVIPKAVFEGDAHQATFRRSRKKQYDEATLAALKKIWVMLDYLCGKRLKGALPDVVSNLTTFKELRLTKAIQKQLLTMSASTIDRALKSERAKHTLKGRAHTKPGTLLKHQVPFRTFSDWNEEEPGFFEMDLVGHEGGNAQGDYCFTLTLTDVATGWTELAAVQNKAEKWVFEAMLAIRQRLPFAIRGLDSDNGSEFINHHMTRFCHDEKITFTRSRPYRKNDNCYVEQKNWSVVRRFVGYARYDTQEALEELNKLNRLLRDYVNFFLPSMKLKEKTRDGARVQRKHHPPMTPYQRLLQAKILSPEEMEKLIAYYKTLNLAHLHRKIRQCQKKLNKLATPYEKKKVSFSLSSQSEGNKKTGTKPSRKKARPVFVLDPDAALGALSSGALSSDQGKTILLKKKPKNRSRFR